MEGLNSLSSSHIYNKRNTIGLGDVDVKKNGSAENDSKKNMCILGETFLNGVLIHSTRAEVKETDNLGESSECVNTSNVPECMDNMNDNCNSMKSTSKPSLSVYEVYRSVNAFLTEHLNTQASQPKKVDGDDDEIDEEEEEGE